MPKNLVADIRTTLQASEIANIFRETLNESSKRVEFHKLSSMDDAFAEIDQFSFGVFASAEDGFLFFKKLWGLQIEVYDKGEFRTVALFAESSSWKEKVATSFAHESIFDRGPALRKINFKKGLGQEKARLVIERMQRADPQLQVD